MYAFLLLAAIHLDGGVFRVANWQPSAEPIAGWSSVFAVYAGTNSDVPPMLGTYSTESGELVFRPRFPLSPGMHLRAVFHAPEESAEKVQAEFDIPKAP